MESEEQHSHPATAANGRQVAHFRRMRGLTQKQLAQISGYSERLIRKAESGGSLSDRTIRDLAGALSYDGFVINPADLICSPESLAREFMAAFAEYEAEMIAHVEHFLDPAAILVCAGDPEKIPFAGEWQGIEGYDRWVRSFFATLVRPQKDFYQPEALSQGNTVVLWGQELAHAPNLNFEPIWVTQRFEFRQGMIIRFDNLFDTDSGSRHLAEARARGLLQD